MPNRSIVVIQARMGSSRLPGKTLRPIEGTPMLEVLIERLEGLDAGALVVATSHTALDDPIENALHGRKSVEVVRGSEANVLSRFVAAIDRFDADTVVRLTADNPFVDAECVRIGLHEFAMQSPDVDIITNHGPQRVDPYGLGVEVFAAKKLLELAGSPLSASDREHVTTPLYEHARSGVFHLMSDDFSDLRWTVDTEDDLSRAKSRFHACGLQASPSDIAHWEREHPFD